MSLRHRCPLAGPPCAICRARAIEAVFARGRPDMAKDLVRGLADAVREELGQAMWRELRRGAEIGREAALKMAARAPAEPVERRSEAGPVSEPRTPARLRAPQRLATLLAASPPARARVLEALKLRDRDLDAILAGRVGLSEGAWRKAWAAVE